MKKSYLSKWFALFLVLALSLTAFAGCSSNDDAGDAGDDLQAEDQVSNDLIPPDDLQALIDEVTQYAADGAMALNGEWGDWHKEMVASGEETAYAGWEDHLKVLQDYQSEVGATYVYVLYTDNADAPAYSITVDASEEPDDFGSNYDWEIQFKEAWEGRPASARSAWEDGPDEYCWSAFAPIYDSEGTVVGILGVDYPAPIVADYPEWNRDSDQWNHLEE